MLTMNKLILIVVMAIIITASSLIIIPNDTPVREIDAIVESPSPKYIYASQHKVNYELKQMYKSKAKNNLIEWKARKALEDEQREIEYKRRNWKRYIDGKYVYGYDERYDPRVYDG